MGDKTGISWTDATWNPTRGCSIVSPGCKNCYAMGVAARFSGPGLPYEGLAKKVNGHPVWTGDVRLVETHLNLPLRWTKPRRIFVDSMSDLFHEKVPFLYIDKVFKVMAQCPQHTFQILTKRPERMRAYMTDELAASLLFGPSGRRNIWPLPNVWLGTSVEDQRRADERVPVLLGTPAAVRFLSAEPLLGRIDLTRLMVGMHFVNGLTSDYWDGKKEIIAGPPSGFGPVNWVIVGGESGPNFRPMQIEWARSLQEQCHKAGVAFFFKQESALRSGQGEDALGRVYHEYPAEESE